MRARWTWIVWGVVFVGATLLSAPRDAQARMPYLKSFIATYPELKTLADAESCAVCHVGEKKSNRNDYGKELATALGAKNVKAAKDIEAALKKAEDGQSSVEGKTFGDLIKEGKLPGKKP